MTIPKNEVPYGTIPIVFIDGQQAQNQGYAQDANNYYVWYTIHFSTDHLSIVFTSTTPVPEFPSLLVILTVFIAVSLSIAVLVTIRKRIP
jgi:hypothetical protein